MLVKLRNTWYAPDGKLYKANRRGTVVSESLRDKLPTGAEIWDDKAGKFVPKGEAPKTDEPKAPAPNKAPEKK